MQEATSNSSTMQDTGARERVTMYVTTWCGDCRMAKRWFDSHGISYDAINIEENEEAAEYVVRINHGLQSVPTIVCPDGTILVEPSARELAQKFAR